MSAKKNETENDFDENKQKTCFIIMPISDHPDYDTGHFDRVYHHLIQPACKASGYKPLRADDPKASHMIMFDILKKIVECDMAICDLSSKNANVFFELGLRQAFNKKTILINDGREKAPFDISPFRHVTYSPSLRIDNVEKDIISISQMLNETESAPEDDVNSIVSLLKIRPAQVIPVELNKNESMLFNMFSRLEVKLDSLTHTKGKWDADFLPSERYYLGNRIVKSPSFIPSNGSLMELLDAGTLDREKDSFRLDGRYLGQLISIDDNEILFRDRDSGETSSFANNFDNRLNITSLRRRRKVQE